METLYFFAFCMAIAYVVYWSLRNDDFSSFEDDDSQAGKFSLRRRQRDKNSSGNKM